MRIITGSARGCKLKAPKGLATRPTADRVKESLFNILGNAVCAARVLDLFAGTGNLGLEALSRGAAHAVFVDQSIESVRIIKENAAHTKLLASAEIVKQDVFIALRKLNSGTRTFNLIFCDPPYQQGLAEKTLRLLDDSDILEKGAILIIEHSCEEEMKLTLNQITLKCSRRYGAAMISFFIAKEPLLAAPNEEEV